MLAHDPMLIDASEQSHFVQFYQTDELLLAKNVAKYLAEGLERGEAAIAIATADHRQMFCAALAALGVDTDARIADQSLVLLDAAATLKSFMFEGYPQAERFERTVGALMRDMLASASGVRAYGEMVGVLWQAQQFPAAIRLEQLWNKLRESNAFSLFCAYPIDIFDKQFASGVLDPLLCAHTHLLSGAVNTQLELAIDRAMDEVLAGKIRELRPLMKGNHRPAWAEMPRGEAMILWLRNNLPEQADEILNRARGYYHTHL